LKPTGVLAALILFVTAGAYDANIRYFARARDVMPSAGNQNYIIVDSDIWKFARPDLADIRLYDGATQVPYALVKQSGGSETQESAARILNLGTVSGHTEFDLDVRNLAEFDQVRLQLDAKNFINRAQVKGLKSLTDHSGTDLGSSTLYDFTAEQLGSNSALKFRSASFPFIHVRLAPGIRPSQVKGAYLSNFSETAAAWLEAGQCAPVTGAPRQTVFQCSVQHGVPIDRVSVDVAKSPDAAHNFSRTIHLQDEAANEILSGNISRVVMKRGIETVSNENLNVEVPSHLADKFRVIIDNRDDAPLAIQHVHVLSYQRRLYFDPRGKTGLRLYYGDAKLEPPSYDYQQFFQQSAGAGAAPLGPPEANAQFSGRPDERPWSERHGWVLWAAMLAAIAVLGGLALKGLKSNA
jgi:hypothetical protein